MCSFEEKGQKQWEARHTDSSCLTKPDCTISITAGVNLHVVSKLQSPALVLPLGTALCRAVSPHHHLSSAPSIVGPLGEGGGRTAVTLSTGAGKSLLQASDRPSLHCSGPFMKHKGLEEIEDFSLVLSEEESSNLAARTSQQK